LHRVGSTWLDCSSGERLAVQKHFVVRALIVAGAAVGIVRPGAAVEHVVSR